VLVLVFDSPLATRQATGGDAAALPGAITVRDRNVVVFYRGPDGAARRKPIAKALRTVVARD
jgi:hypothetical protein